MDMCTICDLPGATMMCTCTGTNLPLHAGCIGDHINANPKATHVTMPLIFANFNSELPSDIQLLLYKQGLSNSILDEAE